MSLIYSKQFKNLTKFVFALFIIAVLVPGGNFARATEGEEAVIEETGETELEAPPEEPQEEPTVIETGDAASGTDVINEVNTNNTSEGIVDPSEIQSEESAENETENGDEENNTPEESPSTEDSQTEPLEELEGSANELDEVSEEGGEESGGPDNNNGITETVSENDNEANVANDADIEAETGENLAQGDEVYIDTGNASAFANVVNLVNTNIFNSDGFLGFFNQLFGNMSLDLRSLFSVFEEGDSNSNCSLSGCSGGDINFSVSNNNTAYITNDVIVRSSTGGNTATSTDGSAYIQTGDAYSAANILNIANTNITNSNYLLLSINNIGSMVGDIVLPGKSFFESLFQLKKDNLLGGNCSVVAENTNQANIENNTTTNAETGENNASGENVAVQTGDAYSSTNVYNQANTNIFGADSFLILFRVNGSWIGDVLGLPEDLLWSETPDGIEIYNTSEGEEEESEESIPEPESQTEEMGEIEEITEPQDQATDPESGNEESIGEVAGAEQEGQGVSDEGTEEYSQNEDGEEKPENACLEVTNNNDATILNNVDVFALTGENKIDSSGEGAIQTGDAYAASNITNVVNTNVLGRNWVLLIFNILGDWTGNITFGRPNLWLGTNVETEGEVGKGSQVTYKFTVSNLGDADATNVTLRNNFNNRLIKYSRFDTFDENENGQYVTWQLGDIPSGETIEFAYQAIVDEGIPEGVTPITTTATVTANETDDDPEDNTDVVTITASNIIASGSISQGDRSRNRNQNRRTPPSDLVITKIASTQTATAPSTVSYTVNVKNNGSSAYQAYLVDTMKKPDGTVLGEDNWNLGQIYPDEDIQVTYDVVFGADTTPGDYTNYALVYALDGYDSVKKGKRVESDVASATVKIIGEEQVLGLATCEPYLTSYLRYGQINNYEEVNKLQTFLRDSEKFEVSVTGLFDEITDKAVKIFQEKYRGDILDPWGVPEPTGYVYYTTQKKINDISCAGVKEFPLTVAQRNEISSYKNRRQSLVEASESETISHQNKLVTVVANSSNKINASFGESRDRTLLREPIKEPRERRFPLFENILNIVSLFLGTSVSQ